jgi:hypothetical protein
MTRRARERRQALTEALEGLRDVGPLNGGRSAHGRARFLRLAAALRQEIRYETPQNLASLLRGARRPLVPVWRVAVTVATVVALLFGGTGVGVAAQDRVPGDLLYPVKTALEQGRSLVTVEPASRTRLASAYADRRIEELDTLLDIERYAGVPVAVDGLTHWVYNVGRGLDQAVVQNLPDVEALADQVARDTARWEEALDDVADRVPESLGADIASVAALVDQVAESAITVGSPGASEGEAAPTATVDPEGGDEFIGAPDPSATPEPEDASGKGQGEDEAGRDHVPPGLTRTPPGLDDRVTPSGLEREEGTKLPPGLVKPKKTRRK